MRFFDVDDKIDEFIECEIKKIAHSMDGVLPVCSHEYTRQR